MVKCLSCPNESYIGETSRVVKTKMKEHSNSKDSAVAGHIRETGHSFSYKSTIRLLINKFYPIHYISVFKHSTSQL